MNAPIAARREDSVTTPYGFSEGAQLPPDATTGT